MSSLSWGRRVETQNVMEQWGNTRVLQVPFTGRFDSTRMTVAINPVVRKSFNPGRVQNVVDNDDGTCMVVVFHTCVS